MTKEFEQKIISEGVVDTDKYRYVYECDSGAAIIKRIGIDCLDTTAALSGKNDVNPFGWEIVREFG